MKLVLDIPVRAYDDLKEIQRILKKVIEVDVTLEELAADILSKKVKLVRARYKVIEERFDIDKNRTSK